MKYKFFLINLLFSAFFASCSFSSYESSENNNNKIENTNIEEVSELFKIQENKEENETYVFETNDTKYLSGTGYTLWTEKIKNESSNFSGITVTTCKESGNQEAGFGLIFCSQKIDEKSFMLTVLINAKGYFAIGKVIDGTFSHINNGWKECKTLHTGFGVKNTISVLYNLESKSFELKLNGEKVASFTTNENITFKDSYSGYVVVISDNENFPASSVKVIFTNK